MTGQADGRRVWSKILTVLRFVLVVAAVALGVAAIARDVAGFLEALAAIGALRALGALALTLLGLRLSVEVWRITVRTVAGDLPREAANRVFFVSQLGKYLPGGVWTILAQVERARVYELSQAHMGVAGLLFIGLNVVTGFLVAAVTLPWSSPELYTRYWWAAILVVPAAIALLPPVLRFAVHLSLRVLRRPALETHLTGRDVAAACGWLVLVWSVYGGATALLTEPLTETSVVGGILLAATGAWALAWVVGVVIIPAPAGLGPREVVLFLALAPVVGAAGATSIAVSLRVVHSVSDLLLALGYGWPAGLFRRRQDRQAASDDTSSDDGY